MTVSSQRIENRRRRSVAHKRQDEVRQLARQLLVVTGILLILGAFALFSASSAPLASRGLYPYSTVLKQLGFIALGLILAWTLSGTFASLSERWLKALIWISFLGNIVLLVLVRFTPLGPEINGVHRWLRIGFVQFQPAELLKLTLVLAIATVLLAASGRAKPLASFRTERGELMTVRRDRLQLLWVYLAVLASAGLVVIQPDLGTTAIVLATSFVMLFLVGVSLKSLLKFSLVIVILGIIGYLCVPEKYQYARERIYTVFHPLENVSNEGYQIAQSLGAVSQGGLLGRGYMRSQQKMNRLPLQDRDFIFAVWVEETGLLGGLLVVGLFLYLGFLCLRISALMQFSFEGVAAFGLGFYLALQALTNIGTNVGVLPVSGLTLPFFSSGGTSMLVSLLTIGTILGLIRRMLPSGAGRS